MKPRILVGLMAFLAGSLAFSQETAPKTLDIDGAVAYALQRSPLLARARAEVLAAKSEVEAARGKAAPQLSANAFASRGDMPSVLSTGMGVEPQALVLSPGKPSTDLNLTLMAPLYTGGKLSAAIGAAGAREGAARAEEREVRAEVALVVREAYMRAVLSEEMAKAQQARVDAAQSMVANAKAQFEVGKAIEAGVQRAEAELAEAQRELTLTLNDRSKMMLDLLQALGAKLDSDLNLSSSLKIVPVTQTLDEYIRLAEMHRGALEAAGHWLQAAQGELSSARGAQGPQLYGFAMRDTFSPRDEMGRPNGYTYGLSLSVPIFDGGMRRSEVSTARAMVDGARADQTQAKLQTEKEVRAAWLDLQTANVNYITAQTALLSAQSAYDVIVLRVENGKSILVEQLDALAALTRAKANVTQSIFDYQLAAARLNRAAGIGDPTNAGGKP